MIRDLIEEVLLHQTDWDHRKTPAMDRRGVIVRRELPGELRRYLPLLNDAVSLPGVELSIEGRDGTGPKTEIPWTRIFERERSERATMGWYVTYLFSAEGDTCYLTLAHGSTVWTGMEFRPRPARELHELVEWARGVLRERATVRADLLEHISLDTRRSNLGPSYEAGTAFGIAYPIDQVPNDDRLIADLKYMSSLLGVIYRADDVDPRVPGREPQEVLQVDAAIKQAAGQRSPRGRGSGQGFGLSKAEQDLVSEHAVAVALKHLQALGWTDLKDVGATESFDISGQEGDEPRFVEVKGTTSLGASVVLTRNEVRLHQENYPRTALLIVHTIDLMRTETGPKVSGGVLREIRPWSPEDERLEPMAYKYRVPES